MLDMLNWLDFTILGIIAFVGLVGATSGFFRQLAVFIALVIAVITTWLLGDLLAVQIGYYINNSHASLMIAYSLLFSLTFYVTRLIFRILLSLGNLGKDLSLMNRFAGLLMSMFYMTLIFVFATSIIERTHYARDAFGGESSLVPYLASGGDYVYDHFPEAIKDILFSGKKEITADVEET